LAVVKQDFGMKHLNVIKTSFSSNIRIICNGVECDATRFSTLRRNEPSFDIIKNKKKGGGRENTFLVILLYVFLRLTNPTPEKSTVGSRCVLIKLQSENKKQTVYDYTWPTCKRMSGSQVMGNCVGRVFFLKGGWCVQQQLHHHAVE
jgi:hypothetical protein